MEYKGKNGNLYENYSLLNYNTFRLDVTANYFFEYSTVAGLVDFFEQNNIDISVLHIGSGSNLLFKNDFNGLVLHSKIKTIECLEKDTNTVLVRVGSGVDWDQFVDYAVNKGWYGVENLSYIPGEVGASAVQNIGAYGVEVKDVIEFVDTITADGKERRFSVEECEYGYRSSYFKRPENRNLIVTHVAFRLKLNESFVVDYGSLKKELKHYPELTLPVLRQVIIDVRQSKLPDPSVLGNAGSFFMNPVVSAEKFAALKSKYPDISFYALEDGTYKIPAAWLIDYCGWKGKGIGDAMVFDKQALVIVNKGNATGKDIVALSDAVRASVRKEFAIEIYPEVNFVSE